MNGAAKSFIGLTLNIDKTMSNEPKKYPQWFLDMAQDLLDMRDAQREYFGQPNEYRLKLSKARETKVDNGLEHFVREGIIAHKPKPKDLQQNLFD